MMANCRSVLPKLDEVRTTLFLNDIDIFISTESWLNDTHDNNTVSIDGYVCHRADRIDRIGGGVAVWSKTSIPIRRVQCDYSSDFESLLLCLTSLRIILLSMYVSSTTSIRKAGLVNEYVISCLDKQLQLLPDYFIIFCGDLNRIDVREICLHFDLINLNSEPTYGNSELDYILISQQLSRFYRIELSAPVDKSKTPHSSLVAIPSTTLPPAQCIDKFVYDLRHSNVNSFVSLVASTDWSFIDNPSISLDAKCIAFHSHLENLARASIPVSTVRCSAKDKPWITPIVKDLINQRWRAYRLKNYTLYNHLKAKVKKEIEHSKLIWFHKNRVKQPWKVVNCLRGVDRSTNPLISLLNQFTTLRDAVNSINEHLSSVFAVSESCHLRTEDNDDWNIVATPEIVSKMIAETPTSKSSPDLPIMLYKSVCDYIAVPIAKLITESIASRMIPVIWKTCAVCPVPKVSNPSMNDLRQTARKNS